MMSSTRFRVLDWSRTPVISARADIAKAIAHLRTAEGWAVAEAWAQLGISVREAWDEVCGIHCVIKRCAGWPAQWPEHLMLSGGEHMRAILAGGGLGADGRRDKGITARAAAVVRDAAESTAQALRRQRVDVPALCADARSACELVDVMLQTPGPDGRAVDAVWHRAAERLGWLIAIAGRVDEMERQEERAVEADATRWGV